MRHRRSQSGFTLIEVLATVAISSVIMVPLLAWMTLAFRSEVTVTHNSAMTASRNLLASYLPRDVGSAATVDSVATDCSASPPPAGPAGAAQPVLSLVGAGTNPRRTTYLVRPIDSESGTLVRRTCDVGTAGAQVIEDIEVVENVALPSTTSVAVACETTCTSRLARINFSVTLADGAGRISVTASRRIGADP